MKDFKCFIEVKNNIIEFVSEKKLEDNQIEVFIDFEINILSDLNGYKYKNKKIIKLEQKEDISITKRSISKKVSIYINEVLEYFDYDGLADLEICSKMKNYEKEANSLKKWIEEVYNKYDSILEQIDDEKGIKFDIEDLPKFKEN